MKEQNSGAERDREMHTDMSNWKMNAAHWTTKIIDIWSQSTDENKKNENPCFQLFNTY